MRSRFPRSNRPIAALTAAVVPLLALLTAAAPAPARQTAEPQAPPSRPAETPPPPGTPGAAPAEPGRYIGVATCASATCHGSTVPLDVNPVLQNEYYTWLQQDRHARAYEVLFDERSKIIAHHLRVGAPEKAQVCLDCHALTPPAGAVAGRLEIEDGVSCESCHGPASGWVEGHRSEGWSRSDSVAAGLTDLRDPAVRAEACVSCHVGDSDRQVDHAMLAAGHPVLLFELDNYTEAMPPHWAPAGAYDDPHRAREAAAGRGVHAWVLGLVRGLEQRLEIFAHRASTGPRPEPAEFRCDDCHHSLAEERWRTLHRGRVGGLPVWNDARWRVLRPLVLEAAPERVDALNLQIGAISAGAWSSEVAAADAAAWAEDLAADIADVEPALVALSWDDRQIRRRLAYIADEDQFDYDGAVQTLFAVNTLTAELIARRPELARYGLPEAIDEVDRALQTRSGFDRARVEALLGGVANQVRSLP